MADNVAISAGSGTTIAADEVADGTLGTVKVQFVKLMDGTLDGTSKAVVGANGLAVSAAQSGTWTVQPGNTANTTAWKVDGSGVTQPVSGTFWQATQPVSLATNTPSEAVSAASGGVASASRIPSAAATTNATSAKGSAGRVYKIVGYNNSGALRYLKFYNKASAPTVGSDTVVMFRPLPPGGFSFDWADIGFYFSTGIAYALTTGSADADTTALSAGDILALSVEYN